LSAATSLWLTIVAIGLYHGVNPAMGWPLAVANGLTERNGRAVFATILPLGGGHFAAMAVVLVPFMLGLCAPASDAGRIAAAHADVMAVLARSGMAIAFGVAAVHTLAMMLAGLAMAWAVYRYLGLQFLRRAWFNLDVAWGLSLVVAGVAGLITAM
jgi:hypothetical protein